MEIQLRIVLLIIGLLILTGVAIDLFRRRKTNLNRQHREIEPVLEIVRDPDLDLDLDLGLGLDLDLDQDLNLDQELYSEPEFAPKPTPEPIDIRHILPIFIMAINPDGFYGADLYKALNGAYLYIGKNNLFYCYANDNGTGEQLFSVAKAVEPGYFNLETLKDERVPGITLILLPNKVQDAALALDKLIRVAKQLAFVLNGELLDHNRDFLTLTTIDSYREQLCSLELQT